jgi:cytidine kinase
VAGDTVPDLVVVGSVSSDRLRLPGGRQARVGGGAGLYASLGAAAVSTRVGLAGLYSDDLDGETAAWLRASVDIAGLLRVPGRCLRFDIVYDEAGRVEYAIDGAEAEELISYQHMPEPFTHARGFHLCPTGAPPAQLAMAQALRADPRAATAVVSATTFHNRIIAAFDIVHALWSLVDLLVCNTEEAMLLTKRETPDEARGRIVDLVRDHQRSPVVVTRGAAGVDIVNAQGLCHVPAYPSRVVDPTGAGESFAGALLAAWVAGKELPQAAVSAAAIASITVEGIGPAQLRRAAPRELRRRAAAIAENGGIYV